MQDSKRLPNSNQNRRTDATGTSLIRYLATRQRSTPKIYRSPGGDELNVERSPVYGSGVGCDGGGGGLATGVTFRSATVGAGEGVCAVGV